MMRPGTYVRLRREAAGLTIADVAARIETAPRYSEIDRVEWLFRIEADIAALSPDVCASLDRVFPLSRYVLARLIDLRSYGDLGVEMPRICSSCGCSETDPCISPASGTACAWTEHDLCTRCAEGSSASHHQSSHHQSNRETARAA